MSSGIVTVNTAITSSSDCDCDDPRSLSPGTPIQIGGGGGIGRYHFRQFCHCNCSCIHRCHHLQEECASDQDRAISPKMPSSVFRRGSTASLASLLEELESGRMSASLENISYSSSTVGKKKQLSDFRLERDLGEGSCAFVKQVRYRGMDDTLSSPMVMKMVIKSKLVPESILHDFDTGLSLPVELFALRHLREHPHPNIINMIDAFEDSMYYYILMPLHGRGEDLFETIEKNVDFLPIDRVGRIFSQVAMAVAHLHTALGLVHRDIKDENIIIDEHDQIQLIDFGSCSYYNGGAGASFEVPLTEADVRCGRRLSKYHTFYGTIDYAPPEIIRGEHYDGPKQDIWALGILLYTLTFKEVPFRSTTDILENRLRIPFEPSPEIVALIRKLLSHDPSDRPSAEDLIKDPWILENYQNKVKEIETF